MHGFSKRETSPGSTTVPVLRAPWASFPHSLIRLAGSLIWQPRAPIWQSGYLCGRAYLVLRGGNDLNVGQYGILLHPMVCWQNKLGNKDVRGQRRERGKRRRIYSWALWKVLGQLKSCGQDSHFGRRAGSWESHHGSGQFQNSQLGAQRLLHINKYHQSMSLLERLQLICNEKQIFQSGWSLKSLKFYRSLCASLLSSLLLCKCFSIFISHWKGCCQASQWSQS